MLFLCLWLVGSIISACITPFVCDIIGFDDEIQVVPITIVVGLVFAIIMTPAIGG
jgi:hypothetical protein